MRSRAFRSHNCREPRFLNYLCLSVSLSCLFFCLFFLLHIYFFLLFLFTNNFSACSSAYKAPKCAAHPNTCLGFPVYRTSQEQLSNTMRPISKFGERNLIGSPMVRGCSLVLPYSGGQCLSSGRGVVRVGWASPSGTHPFLALYQISYMARTWSAPCPSLHFLYLKEDLKSSQYLWKLR